MFASPFDNVLMEPTSQSVRRPKLTIDDLIEVLRSAKEQGLQEARATLAADQKQQRQPDLVDLGGDNTLMYMVAEKVFANGDVYRPVTGLIKESDIAFRQMADIKRNKAQNAAFTVDPSTVHYTVLTVNITGQAVQARNEGWKRSMPTAPVFAFDEVTNDGSNVDRNRDEDDEEILEEADVGEAGAEVRHANATADADVDASTFDTWFKKLRNVEPN